MHPAMTAPVKRWGDT